MNKEITVTLTDDEGNPTTQCFTVERTFRVKGHDYIALIPKEDDDNVYLFDFTQTEGQISLLEIQSDDEYDDVAAAYEAMLGE